MYGGSGKLGRGGGGARGGGAGGKRNIQSTFHPPPLHRPSSAAAPGGRLSMGGSGAAPRHRTASASAGAAASSSAEAEESFSLVTGNPLNFAMIIRLAPDLVEEIKRVESEGSVARIKFDANANNSTGNVISVGDKNFRFTWSRETGELCDIYEERQSGEEGNGLLVESGCAWRKLNVQRVLDESTKNHVKMRSEEAERKLKSRKAIVLDHGTPSMKSQMKALAVAESNPWRSKGGPFKKRKAEPPPGGPPKSVHKSVLSTTPPLKGRHPASPPSSPPEESVAPGSPIGSGSLVKGHGNVEDIVSLQATNRTVTSDKDASGRVISRGGRGKSAQKGIKEAQPADLQSMLIFLLRENPSKGMSLKDLEKAIGDTIPNSVRQIEPILKKIATFQAPGRYFLKPGVEAEGLKKASSGNHSSPEDNRNQSPAQDDRQVAPDTSFAMPSYANELNEWAELDSKSEKAHISQEKGDALHHSGLFGDKKVSENSEGPIGSSSDSGSDSDSESDSSDSGSDSSRSRSRSQAGSATGSSSDSETDASTNSKDASDEDVDIMTSDDDKQAKHKLQASGLGSSGSPFLWRTSDVEPDHMESDEKQDGHVSDVNEIEKDLPEDQPVVGMDAAGISSSSKGGQNPVERITPSLYYHHEDQEKADRTAKMHKEAGTLPKDRFNHGQSDSSEKASRGKYKRVSDEKEVDDKPDRGKRLKSENSHQTKVSPSRTTAFEHSYQNSSLDGLFEEIHKGDNNQMDSRIKGDANIGFGSQKSRINTSLGKSISDSVQPIKKSVDSSARAKPSASVERPGKHSENMGRGVKQPARHQMTDAVSIQKDKLNGEIQDDCGSISYKGAGKLSKDDSGEKYTTPFDSRHRKHDASGNVKEFGSGLNSNSNFSLKDGNMSSRDRSLVNGRPNALQRELSDLELGELREPLPEETPGFNKQLDRKSSFKQLENKSLGSENGNLDSSKPKLGNKMNADSRKSSPLPTNIPFLGISEDISNRGIRENSAEDTSRPNQRIAQPQQRQQQPRVDYADAGTQHNRVVELSGRSRQGEVGRSLDATPVQGNIPSKGSASVPQEHGTKQGAGPPSRKESRRQKSSTIPDLNDKQKDTSLTGSCDGYQKRREPSSDENSCPYSKYEKDEPELKEPIKDWSQYKEYVEEFQEKHGIYMSLNKILESYREEFLKYGRELEASKGKDMQRYHDVERQIKESYRHCGERFKRLKKIFIVLHEELQHLKRMIHEFGTPYLKDLKD